MAELSPDVGASPVEGWLEGRFSSVACVSAGCGTGGLVWQASSRPDGGCAGICATDEARGKGACEGELGCGVYGGGGSMGWVGGGGMGFGAGNVCSYGVWL